MPERMPMLPLTKVCVSLPNFGLSKNESLWAQPLGEDLYEVRNVPFAAYGLNLRDVVHATRRDPQEDPEIDRVVKRSGHTTYRLLFLKSSSAGDQDRTLAPLRALGATGERGGDVFYAVSVPPQADAAEARLLLDTLVDLGVVLYESAEARQPGSFDALPRESLTRATRLVDHSRVFKHRPL